MRTDFDGNFLHNLPIALVPKQRIALEAISFSLDSIEQLYAKLTGKLSMYEDMQQLNNIQRPDLVEIFSNIWSIIDNAHSVKQLLHGFDKRTKNDEKNELDFEVAVSGSETNLVAQDYHANYGEKISSLRNKMDHLSGNINAIVEKKSSQEPLFGTLSYILSNAHDCTNGEFDVATISSTVFIKNTHVYSVINPADIRRKNIIHPVDHLQFSAFDSIKIPITDLFEDTVKLRNTINNDMSSSFSTALRKYAKDHNLEEDDVFKAHPGELLMGLRVKMVGK